MNVLDNYNPDNLNLGDPIEIEDELYFCKFSYNNMPFMVKTNKICMFKQIKKNKDNYVNISITSKEYLIWFDAFYRSCIQLFFERSEDWFEDPLTISDIEFSFINPLKSNIKDNCFDIHCITNEDILHIVDTKDNVCELSLLQDCNIIPTFHIKGVKFNNKHFSLEIEVNNIYIILDENENNSTNLENNDNNTNVNVNNVNSNNVNTNIVNTNNVNSNNVNSNNVNSNNKNLNVEKIEKPDELNEVTLLTENLEEMSMNIESNGFYKIYELIDEKIKDNIIQNLQKAFIKKKIKINIDLSDIFDDDEEE